MHNAIKTIAALSVCLPILMTSVTQAAFVLGHTYAPVTDGYIIEYDENLKQVGMVQVPGVLNTTGATFGANGNLVFIGRRNDGVFVMEVDSAGALVRQYHVGAGLLLGSYIDYNPATGMYAVADDDRVIILDRNLEYVTSTISSFEFSRASGVAWGPNNTLFATDVLDDDLIEFDSNLNVVDLDFVGEGPTGMDYANGQLYMSLIGKGSLQVFDPLTDDATFIAGAYGPGDMSDVVVLPDGNLLTTDKDNFLRLFSPAGTLLAESTPTIFTGDGIAYYIPAPGASLFIASVCLFRTHRRRRSNASN